jgi:HD-like signal output (HDOD) protein
VSAELILLAEILRRAQAPDCVLHELIERIGASPTLARDVVRVANSALYGMEGRITRLDRAVLILGTQAVAQIAGTTLVAAQLRRLSIGALAPDALLLHNLEIAITAELCARCLGLDQEPEAYLAGLLHDLGIVELHARHGARYEELLELAVQTGADLEPLELATLGTTHALELADVSTPLGLPPMLIEALAAHHAPTEAPSAARPLALLVRAAHAVARAGAWTDMPESDAALLRELGLDDQDLEEIGALAKQRLSELVRVL